MTSRLKTPGPTSISASSRTWWKSPLLAVLHPVVDFVVRVLHLDDGAVHQHADGDMAMPASDMRLAFCPMKYMGTKARATDTGMVTMGTTTEGTC